MRIVFRKIGFLTAFIVPALVIIGFYLGGAGNYLALLFAFIILPMLDKYAGIDKTNVPENDVKLVGDEYYYRFVTYMWTYVQLAFVIWGAFAVSSGELKTIWHWIGFIISVSLVTGGIGITVAHELGHKKPAHERLYSRILLMTVCYMHFYIEHNRGHHVTVATPEDPATARRDETFFAFWIRSVFYGYLHAWSLENESLRRRCLKVMSFKNEMLWYTFLPVLFCFVLTLGVSFVKGQFTWQVPIFFFTQSFFAFSLLELVNYVEHYGIMRKELSPGKYERINPIHSWNSSFVLSNFFLFQLQRHSDHHAFTYKRYQILNHYDESPQLPFGYSTMIIIALVPPLWFTLMNKRLEEWQTSKPIPT